MGAGAFDVAGTLSEIGTAVTTQITAAGPEIAKILGAFALFGVGIKVFKKVIGKAA